ncbi:MAG: hypothetical protein Q3972_03995 [Corynebacterium sp.]|nr:hypothetical protein [Corynebacterium sp.]
MRNIKSSDTLTRTFGKLAVASLLSVAVVTPLVATPTALAADVQRDASNPTAFSLGDNNGVAQVTAVPDIDANGRLTGTVRLTSVYNNPFFNSSDNIYLIDPTVTASNITYSGGKVSAFNFKSWGVNQIALNSNVVNGNTVLWQSVWDLINDPSNPDRAYGLAPRVVHSAVNYHVDGDHTVRVELNNAHVSEDTTLNIGVSARDAFGGWQFRDAKNNYAKNYVARAMNGWHSFAYWALSHNGENSFLKSVESQLWAVSGSNQLSNAGVSGTVNGETTQINQVWALTKYAMEQYGGGQINSVTNLGVPAENDAIRNSLLAYLQDQNFGTSDEIAAYVNQVLDLSAAATDGTAASKAVTDHLREALNQYMSATYPNYAEELSVKLNGTKTLQDVRNLLNDLPNITSKERREADLRAESALAKVSSLTNELLDATTVEDARKIYAEINALHEEVAALKGIGSERTTAALQSIEALLPTAKDNYDKVTANINTGNAMAAAGRAKAESYIETIESAFSISDALNIAAAAKSAAASASTGAAMSRSAQAIADAAAAAEAFNKVWDRAEQLIAEFDAAQTETSRKESQVLRAAMDATQQAENAKAAGSSEEAEQFLEAAHAALAMVAADKDVTTKASSAYADAEAAIKAAEDAVRTMAEDEARAAAQAAADAKVAELVKNIKDAKAEALASDKINVVTGNARIGESYYNDALRYAAQGTSASTEILADARKDLADMWVQVEKVRATQINTALQNETDVTRLSNYLSTLTAAYNRSIEYASRSHDTNPDTNEGVLAIKEMLDAATILVENRVKEAVVNAAASIEESNGVINRAQDFAADLIKQVNGWTPISRYANEFEDLKRSLQSYADAIAKTRSDADALIASYSEADMADSYKSRELAIKLESLAETAESAAKAASSVYLTIRYVAQGADQDPDISNWSDYLAKNPANTGNTDTTSTTAPSTSESNSGSESTANNPGGTGDTGSEPSSESGSGAEESNTNNSGDSQTTTTANPGAGSTSAEPQSPSDNSGSNSGSNTGTNTGNNTGTSTEPSTGSTGSNSGSNTGSTPSTSANAGTNSGATTGTVTVADKSTAYEILGKLENLTSRQYATIDSAVSGATDMEALLVVVRQAIIANANAQSGVSDTAKANFAKAVNEAKDLESLRALAIENLNAYSDGDVAAPSTSTTTEEQSTTTTKKFNWLAVILAVLGVGSAGALGWGYVHDADFRAVVDGAIANIQRSIDQALGRR